MVFPGENKTENPEQESRPDLRPASLTPEGRPVEFEQTREQAESAPEQMTESYPTTETSFTPGPAGAATLSKPPKSDSVMQIEKVLEEGLQPLYEALDPQTKRKFQQTGETTAAQIDRLMQSAKIQVKKILKLIKQWLSIIPRLNRHYLEQEAKIKTDKILAMKQRR